MDQELRRQQRALEKDRANEDLQAAMGFPNEALLSLEVHE
jgi:hypothetical protein